jgi:hypothetical protein
MFVRKCLWCSSAIMKMKEESGSLAAILERELEPTVREWLRRVNLVSELTDIPLSDADRAGHLPQVYSDLISRLRLPKDKHAHISADATAHGQRRREQGYSAAMLIAESRIFEVVTFRTLHPYHSELDQRRLLLDVMVIADEADAQLMGAVRSLTAKGMPTRSSPDVRLQKMLGLLSPPHVPLHAA